MTDEFPSQDYPIRHFALMHETARTLKSLPAQVLDHSYSYETFGSWTLILRYKGVPYKLVWDGKERMYSLDRSATKKHPYEWSELWHRPAPGGDPRGEAIADWITAAHGVE